MKIRIWTAIIFAMFLDTSDKILFDQSVGLFGILYTEKHARSVYKTKSFYVDIGFSYLMLKYYSLISQSELSIETCLVICEPSLFNHLGHMTIFFESFFLAQFPKIYMSNAVKFVNY